MPIVKVETDPRKIAEQLVAWLDAPEDEEGYDGFDIDPYDSEIDR